MAPIALALVVVVVGGVLAWRAISKRKDLWSRTRRDDGSWELTNQSGSTALDVRVEVKGRGVRGEGVGEVGNVDAGASITFTTADDAEAEGGSPMVTVSWQTQPSGRRSLWAAPLSLPKD